MTIALSEKLKIVNDHIDEADPPIHVIPLANKLGIEVYKADWPHSVSGKIQYDPELGGQSGFAIFVNAAHPETRRRFTIAHEIAHFILHEDQIGDGLFDDAMYRSGLSSFEEDDANKLAADILMPRQLIREFSFVGDDVETLAHQFNVSQSAMARRLGVAW
ncbi:MAG: ImmA/IrrE family metallo-endopeptidase [Rhodobacter sp.]|nr:ImmA/IrrE family metallo-endopeptidase [Rhodobacter sp.]